LAATRRAFSWKGGKGPKRIFRRADDFGNISRIGTAEQPSRHRLSERGIRAGNFDLVY
jgi:hypothetical protein